VVFFSPVLQVGASLFSIVLSLISITSQDIERAFLLNDARRLEAQFSADIRLTLDLPDPLSFSDQVSSEQAFFIFQGVFRRYVTLEFIPETAFYQAEAGGPIVVKARWSFTDPSNNDRFGLRVFFLLEHYGAPPGVRARPGRPGPAWKIIEIKAEKI
jgi:hypothetical protein